MEAFRVRDGWAKGCLMPRRRKGYPSRAAKSLFYKAEGQYGLEDTWARISWTRSVTAYCGILPNLAGFYGQDNAMSSSGAFESGIGCAQ